MNTLVTGGCGFIGSHIVDRLLLEGHEVTVIDNFSTGRPENLEHQKDNPHLKIIEADICDSDKIMPLFIETSINDLKIINYFINNKDNTITNIKYELQNKFVIQYTTFNTFNKPSDVSKMKNTFEVLNDPNLQMLRPGVLKGNKILIVMLWSYELNQSKI